MILPILLSIALFCGSFGIGYLPFFIKIDTTNITIVSAGILVGTGLGIVLPESLEHLDNTHYIGLILLSGFIVMMAVDVIIHNTSQVSTELDIYDHSNNGNSGLSLGLIIHSIADGIALGSACASEEVSLEISIFIALLLHKGPTAFAFVSLLKKQGVSQRQSTHHLLLFSLASPCATVAAYFFLSLFKLNLVWISHLMIFSAGTFIYVATLHVLPEVLPQDRHVDTTTFIFLFIGIIIPLSFELLVNHHH